MLRIFKKKCVPFGQTHENASSFDLDGEGDDVHCGIRFFG